MTQILRACIAVSLSLLMSVAQADARVFGLNNPNPQQILDALHAKYGDKLQADIIQERLVVIGSPSQLNEVGALLARIDPAPANLRLRLREQPPEDERSNVITYSSNSSGYTLDAVEGALISLDYSTMSQQVIGAGNDQNGGWWVVIDNRPTQIHSLTLQIRLQGRSIANILVSYAKEDNQERHVYGSTVSGYLGSWIALLPQPEPAEPGTISSGAKPGSQLYLRIDRLLAKELRPVKR